MIQWLINNPPTFIWGKNRNETCLDRLAFEIHSWRTAHGFTWPHMGAVVRHPLAWLRWRRWNLMRGLFPHCSSFDGDANVSYWIGKGKK